MVSKERKILNQLKSRPQRRTPIATDMFLPNHSGIADHPEATGNFVKKSGDTMTGDLAIADTSGTSSVFIRSPSDPTGTYTQFAQSDVSSVLRNFGSLPLELKSATGNVYLDQSGVNNALIIRNSAGVDTIKITDGSDISSLGASTSLTLMAGDSNDQNYNFTSTGDLVVTGTVDVGTVKNSSTINIQPNSDSDDYIQFTTPSNEPVLKRIGGSHIDFQADSGSTVGIKVSEDGSNSGSFQWNKSSNELEITSTSGEINFSNENLTTTGTLDASGVCTLGVTTVADGSLTATSAAPTTDAMIANKKYVDDELAGASGTTHTKQFYIENPTSSDSYPIAFMPAATTISEVWAETDTGTVDFNIEFRPHGSAETATSTQLWTADKTADDDGYNTTTFNDDTVPTDSWLTYTSSATASSPTKLWIALTYTED